MSLLKSLVLIGGALAELPAGDTVADWNTLANKPSTFPPAVHSHSVADVTGLQTTLDAKANLAGAAFTGGISGTTAAFSSTATFNGAVVFNGAFSVTGASIVLDRVGDAAAAQFYMRADAGFSREFTFQSGTSTRWGLRVNNVAESGGNAGSNLQWISYDDAGAALATPLQIARATGIAAFSASPTAPTPSPGDNTTKLATTAFVTAGIGAAFAANDAMLFKGTIDASSIPNYPAADAGHVYRISGAGKIGGINGPNVEIGDTLYCIVDGSPAGEHPSVGMNWSIVQSNLDGAVIGPASVVNGNPAVFDGATGKLIKEVTFAAFKASLSIAVADVGGLQGALDAKAPLVHAHVIADVTGLQGALDLKAPLASPTFTGVPAGPTAAPGTNTTQIATTAFVTAAVAAGGGGGGPIDFSQITGTLLNAQLSGNYTNVGDLTTTAVRVTAAATAGLFLEAPAGQVKGVYFRTSGAINRWALYTNTLAESGGDAGTNLNISRYADDGTHLGVVFSITRQTGLVTLSNSLSVGNTIEVDRIGDATNAYLAIAGDAGFLRALHYRTGAALRFQAGLDNNAEAGANAGSDYVIWRYDDAGVSLGRALTITRSDNLAHFYGSMQVDGNLIGTAANFDILAGTADGADSERTSLNGGGAHGAARGATLYLYGNEHVSAPGDVQLQCGTQGDLTLIFGSKAAAAFVIRSMHADGADTGSAVMAGGGAATTSRGGVIAVYGNEHASLPGRVRLIGGGGDVYVENAALRVSGDIVQTGKFGGFLWGTKAWDPPAFTSMNTSITTTVSVTGAAVGDLAVATLSTLPSFNGIAIMAQVISANTVEVILTNHHGGTAPNITSGTLNVMVLRAP